MKGDNNNEERFAVKACEILEGIEFRDAANEIDAVNQVAAYLRSCDNPEPKGDKEPSVGMKMSYSAEDLANWVAQLQKENEELKEQTVYLRQTLNEQLHQTIERAKSQLQKENENILEKALKGIDDFQSLVDQQTETINQQKEQIERLKKIIEAIDAAFWADPEPNFDIIERSLSKYKDL